MFKIAVHSRALEKSRISAIQSVLEVLQEKGAEVLLSYPLHEFLLKSAIHFPATAKVFHHTRDLIGTDFFFSIGGDGTLLESVTYVRDTNIPIAGINAGRLGFLATITIDRVKEAIDAIFKGFYSVEKRTLIQVDSDQDVFNGLNFGLNEFSILKRDTSSMIVVHTYIDGEYLNSYWADGLIIATPTGSTGYALSVGGPVVIPQSQNFIIAPVSPHNLNVRPLVVSENCVISFSIEGRSKNFLVSLDSRSRKVREGIQLAVRKCDFHINLIKLNGDNFLGTLRRKLNWGLDIRN